MRLPRLALAITVAGALAVPAGGEDAPPGRRATIHRDAYGVPHVFAATDQGVLFGMAWALAEDDWPLVEENYARALGRIAERDGEAGLQADWLARALEIRGRSLDEYSRATPRLRGLLDAYAAGLNAYLRAHPERKPPFGRVEPWFPLALIRYKYYQSEFLDYAGLRPGWTARLIELGWPAPGVKPPPRTLSDARPARPLDVEESPLGSNEWAVAPSRTASGHAMLLVNPHQRFAGVQRYAEVHLHSAEGLRFSGATVFGFLLPYMGHNERLGWTVTDNYADRGDLYAEAFEDPARPLAYRYGATTREAATWTETITVREGSGLVPREYRFWKTHHGPVVGVDDDNRPLTVRLARYDEGGWYEQWDAMIRARNLGEWKAALARRQVAYMNHMYADADGNIGYVYYSAVPRRDPAFDYSGIVDGSDPRVEWQGFHPLEDLPQVFNPPAGYLLNTNSSPFTATRDVPYTRAQFPRYMLGTETDNPRAVSSRRVLESLSRATFDEFARAVWDSRLSAADEMIPALAEEWARLKTAPATDVPEDLRAARGRADVARVLDHLSRWDRRADVPSVETTWMSLVQERRAQLAKDARPWPWSRALVEALDLLQKRWGRVDVPWGDVSRLQRPLPGAAAALDPARPSLPVGGASGQLGSVFSFYTVPTGDPGPRLGVAGNSFVKVVELAPAVRARSVLNFGQSGDPLSPHFFDQAALYARRAFKEAWFDEAEVEAHAVRSSVVGEDAAAERTLRLKDGVALSYLDAGKGGPALVLIHCGNCRKEIWTETIDAFKGTHRVVAMDLAGHGRSGANRKEWTIPALGGDVAALVDHLKLGKVILVGNSLGGPVALEAARRLGRERVLGIVAVDTLQNVEGVWPEPAWRRLLEAYRKDFPGTCTTGMLSLLPKDAPEAARERVDRETCDNDPGAFLSLFETIRTYDQAEALGAAGVPIRAINATLVPTAVETNRKHARSFEAVIMEGVGHYPQVERPEEFQAHLRRWVAELSAAR